MKLTETATKFILEGDAACTSCNGTGLYVGMAERNGAAVICYHCKGTGKVTIRTSYDKFEGKKKRKDIERVYKTAGGYCITAKDVKTDEGKTIRFSIFGAAYKDWLNGEEPKPIEDLHCPYQHTDQGLQNNDVNGLYKTRCQKALSIGSIISKCPNMKEKHKCWKIYNGK